MIPRITVVSGTTRRRGPHSQGLWLLSSELRIRLLHHGRWYDYGVVSRKTVTIASISEVLTILTGGISTALGNFKYHALGTGTAPESSADTALGAEVGTRVSGTQVRSGQNKYVTVAMSTADFAANVTEHGVFSAATNGVLLDRSQFAAVPVNIGDNLVRTYTLAIVGS